MKTLNYLLLIFSFLLTQQSVAAPATTTKHPVSSTINPILEHRISYVNKESRTTLKDLLGSKEGILIDFWASWCIPCLNNLPELVVKAQEYGDQLAVVGINVEGDIKQAQRIWKSKKYNLKSVENKISWLIEGTEQIFSKEYRVDSIPRVVLLDKTGAVLFNGHPQSPDLQAALKKVLKN